MPNSSRRGFLKYAGVGAAAAGVAVVTPSAVADAKTAQAPEKVALPKNAHGEIVAHVHDVRTGRMSLMVEGHEVTITDKDLAARLATALHAASPRAVNSAR